MKAQIALFVCSIAYIGLIVWGTQVYGDWQWGRKHGTPLQRAITRFDIMRIAAAGLGTIAVGLHFVGRFVIISDVLFIVCVAMLPVAIAHMRIARRHAREQEHRVKIEPKPVTLTLVGSQTATR